MKCKICNKKVNVIEEPYFEIDIYKYNQGINLNYLNEIIICKDCFDKLGLIKNMIKNKCEL